MKEGATLTNVLPEDVFHLQRMIEFIDRIEHYVTSLEELHGSSIVQDAVIRNVELIGEAAKRISAFTKLAHQDICWGCLEVYFGIPVTSPNVDVSAVWTVISKLRELKPRIISLCNAT
jgi:uncharacterized protein with HEPN domain